jgi:hypothetical protein
LAGFKFKPKKKRSQPSPSTPKPWQKNNHTTQDKKERRDRERENTFERRERLRTSQRNAQSNPIQSSSSLFPRLREPKASQSEVANNLGLFGFDCEGRTFERIGGVKNRDSLRV